jgi:hypothetical protein
MTDEFTADDFPETYSTTMEVEFNVQFTEQEREDLSDEYDSLEEVEEECRDSQPELIEEALGRDPEIDVDVTNLEFEWGDNDDPEDDGGDDH